MATVTLGCSLRSNDEISIRLYWRETGLRHHFKLFYEPARKINRILSILESRIQSNSSSEQRIALVLRSTVYVQFYSTNSTDSYYSSTFAARWTMRTAHIFTIQNWVVRITPDYFFCADYCTSTRTKHWVRCWPCDSYIRTEMPIGTCLTGPRKVVDAHCTVFHTRVLRSTVLQ